MNIFILEPFVVSEIFAMDTLLKAGERIQSFERIELKEGIIVLANTYKEQRRGKITKIINGEIVEINGLATFISDILFIIL